MADYVENTGTSAAKNEPKNTENERKLDAVTHEACEEAERLSLSAPEVSTACLGEHGSATANAEENVGKNDTKKPTSSATENEPKKTRKDDRTENERKLFDAVTNEVPEEVTRLLGEPKVRIDCLDEYGMTPLQHAAYRGKKNLAELLLRHGADVNANFHDHGYTTLMFAGLSGNQETTQLILEAGAKTSLTNSVNRTASQMAAFVGQHRIASLINNFFSREHLDYYTVPHGLQKEPKLPPELAPALHKLILIHNIHPVRLVLYLRENKGLLENSVKVCRVLETISDSQSKGSETNDTLAYKLHHIKCMIEKAALKLKEKDDNLDSYLKYLLNGRPEDGYPVGPDKFIRESAQSFHSLDSQVFQQFVRQLAPTKVGDPPGAVSILSTCLFGPMSEADGNICDTCGNKTAIKRCTQCKMVHYCDKDCQKLHWFTHKKFCKKLAEKYKEMHPDGEPDGAVSTDNKDKVSKTETTPSSEAAVPKSEAIAS